MNSHLLLVSGLLAAVLLQVQSARNPKSSNLFDPLFALDDIDAHTVSVSDEGPRNFLHRSVNSTDRARLPPLVADDADKSALRFGQRLPTTTSSTANKRASQLPDFILRPVKTNTDDQQQKRQVVQSQFGAQQTIDISSPIPFSTANARNTASTEEPKHWSALENYYQKVREANLLKTLNAQLLGQNKLDFVDVAQQSINDDRFNINHPNSYYENIRNHKQQPIYKGKAILASSPASFAGGDDGRAQITKQNFQLPIEQQPIILSSQLGSKTTSGDTITYRINHNDGFKDLLPHLLKSNTAPNEQQQMLVSAKTLAPYATGIVPSNQAYQQQQQQYLEQRPEVFAPPMASLSQPPPPLVSLVQRPIVAVPSYEEARERQYEAQRNELLRIQAIQERLKHQQEHLGSMYDHQRGSELLQEEAICGSRRNEVNYKRNLTSQQVVIGEFPSHMGLYNGSDASEDNFLCSGTLVHERFALTLASCVSKWNSSPTFFNNSTTRTVFTIRAGEWHLNRSALSQEQQRQKPTILRQIDRVHLFPRWSSNSTSGEHDLALVEWFKPINFLELPYIWPACQPLQARSSLRASSCWAPLRNVTLTEYFDASGEGETKLKRNVQMVEVPIKLHANDELECQRQTQIQYFNFKHPNFICSADARRSNWRAKLNSQDAFGSGIYCDEAGSLSLVSILHPISSSSQANSTFGYLDLSYYRPWMRNVIATRPAY